MRPNRTQSSHIKCMWPRCGEPDLNAAADTSENTSPNTWSKPYNTLAMRQTVGGSLACMFGSW